MCRDFSDDIIEYFVNKSDLMFNMKQSASSLLEIALAFLAKFLMRQTGATSHKFYCVNYLTFFKKTYDTLPDISFIIKN